MHVFTLTGTKARPKRDDQLQNIKLYIHLSTIQAPTVLLSSGVHERHGARPLISQQQQQQCKCFVSVRTKDLFQNLMPIYRGLLHYGAF